MKKTFIKIFKPKILGPLFFTFLIGLSFYLMSLAFYKVNYFLHLKEKKLCFVEQYDVIEKRNRLFVLATFSFDLDGKRYVGKTLFQNFCFLNYPSVVSYLEKCKNIEKEIWVDPNNPTYASLEKNFPYKTVIYSFITLGILLYFFLLKQKLKLHP